MQDAPQWPTLVRLVAAGLGVTLAPACVASVTMPGAVYREVHAASRTTIELAIKEGTPKILAQNFMDIAQACLKQ